MTLSVSRKTALLAAFSLFLSTIELLIPKPVPFFRIGLANLPLLLGLVLLTPRQYFLLVGLKIFGQGIVGGTLFSYIFVLSLAGSAGSGVVMFLVYQVPAKWRSLIGVSMAGALASNLLQALVASKVLLGLEISLFLFPLLLSGFTASLLLGGIAEAFLRKSRWVKKLREEE